VGSRSKVVIVMVVVVVRRVGCAIASADCSDTKEIVRQDLGILESRTKKRRQLLTLSLSLPLRAGGHFASESRSDLNQISRSSLARQ